MSYVQPEKSHSFHSCSQLGSGATCPKSSEDSAKAQGAKHDNKTNMERMREKTRFFIGTPLKRKNEFDNI